MGNFLKKFISYFYTQNLILLVAWTLQYEILFYLIFSALIINARLGVALLITWFISIFIVNLGHFNLPPDSFITYICNYCSAQFLMGCCATFIVKKWDKYIFAPKLIFSIGVISFILNGIIEDHYYDPFYTTFPRFRFRK